MGTIDLADVAESGTEVMQAEYPEEEGILVIDRVERVDIDAGRRAMELDLGMVFKVF